MAVKKCTNCKRVGLIDNDAVTCPFCNTDTLKGMTKPEVNRYMNRKIGHAERRA